MLALCAMKRSCCRPKGGSSVRNGAMCQHPSRNGSGARSAAPERKRCPERPRNGSGARSAPPQRNPLKHYGHPPPLAFTQTQLSLLSLVNEHTSVVASSIRYMDKRVVPYQLVVVHIPLHPLLHFVQILFIVLSWYSTPDISCLSLRVLAVRYSSNHSVQLLTPIPGIDR